jgi:hypothetical protein
MANGHQTNKQCKTAQNSFARHRLSTAINISNLPTVMRSGGSDSDASEDVALGTRHKGAGCWGADRQGRRRQQTSRKGRYRHTSLHGVIYIYIYIYIYIARRRCPFCVSVCWRRTDVKVKSRLLHKNYPDTPPHRCVCTELDKQQCVTKHVRV